MALILRDYTSIKVVQATYHQVNVIYGASYGIKCSCMSLVSVSWALFRSSGLCDAFDLDCILSKVDQLFKFIDRILTTRGLARKLPCKSRISRKQEWRS